MTYLDEINAMKRPDTAEEKCFRDYIMGKVKWIQEQRLWGKNVKRELEGYIYRCGTSGMGIDRITTDGTYSGSPVLCIPSSDPDEPPALWWIPEKYESIEDAQYSINGFRRILTELGFRNFTLRIDKFWKQETVPVEYPWYDRRSWTQNTRKPRACYLIYLRITW